MIVFIIYTYSGNIREVENLVCSTLIIVMKDYDKFFDDDRSGSV